MLARQENFICISSMFMTTRRCTLIKLKAYHHQTDVYITTCVLTTNNKFFQMRKTYSMNKSCDPMFMESFKVC